MVFLYNKLFIISHNIVENSTTKFVNIRIKFLKNLDDTCPFIEYKSYCIK